MTLTLESYVERDRENLRGFGGLDVGEDTGMGSEED